jgi:hypothetical protein
MWAVLYENGMSLTTASERTARSLALAELQCGRFVAVRRLDDVETGPRSAEKAARRAGSLPEAEVMRPAARFARPEPNSEPGPASAPEPAQAVEPVRAMELVQAAEAASVPEPASEASPPDPTRETQPARAATPTRRRRLSLYVLAAAVIVVAAALVDHWGVLPRLGDATGSSPTQVSGPPRPPQLLPPLEQPPVMHFGNAFDATSTPAARPAQRTSVTARPSGADRATRPTRSPASADAHSPPRLRASAGRPSTIERGG